MVKQRQILKQQSLREAEGYLELLHLGGTKLQPSLEHRKLLSTRALRSLDRITDFGAWTGHAFYLRGQALRMMDRFADAIIPLKLAAEYDRHNISIWLALGWCHKRCERIDLAIESLEEGLIVAPQEAILHYNLACYWSLAKHVNHAVTYLARAFELDSDYRDLAPREADFDPIRHTAAFQALNSVIV